MELFILLGLAILNGVLAMSEIAVVSARKARLQKDAERGHTGSRIAIELIENPNQFLATVQIGISLIGILAGAFGGAMLADDASGQIARIPALKPYSAPLGFGAIVLFTTYLSLVIGELVPKRIGIQYPERIAVFVAPFMRRISTVTFPAVWLLSHSTEGLLWILRIKPSDQPPVTEEEIHMLLREGARFGNIDVHEIKMVKGVFRLDDLRADAVMTPRTEMVWLDINDTHDQIREKLMTNNYSRFAVCEGSPDHILGIVTVQDLLRQSLLATPFDLQSIIQPARFVPESSPASHILEVLRGSDHHVAVIVGEHGGTDGIVTMNDILEAVVGDIDEPDAIQRADGSWLIDGLMPIAEFKTYFAIDELPDEADNAYQTLAGFIVNYLDRIPSVADSFIWNDHYFEVVDMDGSRVDKVLTLALNKDDESDDNSSSR
jgi:putative hemolysin